MLRLLKDGWVPAIIMITGQETDVHFEGMGLDHSKHRGALREG